jgi:hypothetical protein
VKKIVHVFRSFEEAERAERESVGRLTPEERIEMVTRLREQRHPDADQQGFARVYRITQLERG